MKPDRRAPVRAKIVNESWDTARNCRRETLAEARTRPSVSSFTVPSSCATHGHRTLTDSDLVSAFEPRARTFCFCSSVVSEVSLSGQSLNPCVEHSHGAAR